MPTPSTAPLIVTNTNDGGPGSLRQAILEANANPGADTIQFNIAPGGAQTITPATPLPEITSPVTIDGSTQPGFSGNPIIELNGINENSPFSIGLETSAGSSVVRGLVINRFDDDGIRLKTTGSNIIEGNFLGTDLTGTADRGNFPNGLVVDSNSSNNIIGGTVAAARNVISGNGTGIDLFGKTNNQIRGNFIGTDLTGNVRIRNDFNGVSISLSANNNTIGGTTAGARNVISGCTSAQRRHSWQ